MTDEELSQQSKDTIIQIEQILEEHRMLGVFETFSGKQELQCLCSKVFDLHFQHFFHQAELIEASLRNT